MNPEMQGLGAGQPMPAAPGQDALIKALMQNPEMMQKFMQMQQAPQPPAMPPAMQMPIGGGGGIPQPGMRPY